MNQVTDICLVCTELVDDEIEEDFIAETRWSLCETCQEAIDTDHYGVYEYIKGTKNIRTGSFAIFPMSWWEELTDLPKPTQPVFGIPTYAFETLTEDLIKYEPSNSP